jgi:hypothetical protein
MAAQSKQSAFSAVRLTRERVRKLSIVAKRKGKTIGDIVSAWIDSRLEREYREAVEEMNAELGEAGA